MNPSLPFRRGSLGAVLGQGGIVLPKFAAAIRGASSTGTLSNAGTTGGGTATQYQYKELVTVFGGSGLFKFRWSNTTGSNLANGEAPYTLRTGIRLASSSVPILWGGQRDIVVQPGATVESDWTQVTLTSDPLGIYLIHRGTWATPPSQWPWSSIVSYGGTQSGEWGTALGDRTLTNWVGSAVIVLNPNPCLDIVRSDQSSLQYAIALCGDSISSDGQNDSTATYPGIGWAQRGLASSYPWTTIGGAGMSMNLSVIGSNYPQRLNRFFGRGYTHLLLTMIVNDVRSNFTTPQCLAAAQDIITHANANGMKVIVCTSTPLTDASNTADASTAWKNVKEGYNLALRGASPFTGQYVVYDAAASFQASPGANNRWRTDLGATPANDGIHPNTAWHTQAASDFAAALPTLLAA